MRHVEDELELHALRALPDLEEARVAAHLSECGACRARADELEHVVTALQDTLPAREPPPELRARVLASARAERRSTTLGFLARRRRAVLAAGAAAAALALAAGAAGVVRDLTIARDELDQSRAIAERVSHDARTWYMSGVDRWAGAGGKLYVPPEAPAYVVFHDLPAAPAGHAYTIWLIDSEGRWVRGSSFTPRQTTVQMVDVGVDVQGFDRCAVTLEARPEGRREGPIVMQSQMYPR